MGENEKTFVTFDCDKLKAVGGNPMYVVLLFVYAECRQKTMVFSSPYVEAMRIMTGDSEVQTKGRQRDDFS
jgi:hypothetical protein